MWSCLLSYWMPSGHFIMQTCFSLAWMSLEKKMPGRAMRIARDQTTSRISRIIVRDILGFSGWMMARYR